MLQNQETRQVVIAVLTIVLFALYLTFQQARDVITVLIMVPFRFYIQLADRAFPYTTFENEPMRATYQIMCFGILPAILILGIAIHFHNKK